MRLAPRVLLVAFLAGRALPGAAATAEPRKAAIMDPATADARTLREADQALARSVDKRDRSAFEALLSEDAYFEGGGQPLRSRAAVSRAWASFFDPEGPRLTWAPELAEMSRSGDLGYTVGHYQLESRDAEGRPIKREGRYVTVWRREADGVFRVAVDSPLVPPAEGGPGDLRRSPDRKLSSRDGDLVVEAGTWRPGSDGGAGGLYLSIRRRTREGTLADALETIVPGPAERE